MGISSWHSCNGSLAMILLHDDPLLMQRMSPTELRYPANSRHLAMPTEFRCSRLLYFADVRYFGAC